MGDREDIENTAELSDKKWKRVIDAAAKSGYREGVEEGRRSIFQEGFDIGYEEAFETAFILGKYKGLATALQTADPEVSLSPIHAILDKTRRGACRVCVEESKRSNDKNDDFSEPPIENIKNEQKKYSTDVVKKLQCHFDKLLKERGVSIDDLCR